jgi:BTB/POZ domain-containing adapter for CUL3-mediated RhoA degradation protein
LNCLLYENRNGPDQELMQATSLRVPVASSYTSDDEEGDRQRSAAAAHHHQVNTVVSQLVAGSMLIALY